MLLLLNDITTHYLLVNVHWLLDYSIWHNSRSPLVGTIKANWFLNKNKTDTGS